MISFLPYYITLKENNPIIEELEKVRSYSLSNSEFWKERSFWYAGDGKHDQLPRKHISYDDSLLLSSTNFFENTIDQKYIDTLNSRESYDGNLLHEKFDRLRKPDKKTVCSMIKEECPTLSKTEFDVTFVNRLKNPYGLIGWHTNHRSAGVRVAFSHSDEDHKSFYRFANPKTGSCHTQREKSGWTLRIADLGSGKKTISKKLDEDYVLWHTIHSECERFSLGLKHLEAKCAIDLCKEILQLQGQTPPKQLIKTWSQYYEYE